MVKLNLSTKHLQISKASATMLGFMVVASFIFVFTLFAGRALLSQRNYQARVIEGKETAKQQLDENQKAVDSLVESYKQFVGTSENILGGNPQGSGDNDGDNAKIVLDALPSKYDFPAVATSLEKLVVGRNYALKTITGVDDEINQQQPTTGDPQPVELPFQLSVGGSYATLQDLITVFERSIRPFQIMTLTISGDETDITMDINAKTFYQPEKTLNISSQAIQ